MLKKGVWQGDYASIAIETIIINQQPNYLLIDEAQDFNRISIEDFLNSAQRGCVFYGDDTQSIMGFANPMHLGDIEALLKSRYGETGAGNKVIIYRYTLKRNWRLSKEIAAFAQALPNGVSDPDLLTRCRGEYHEKPILRQIDSEVKMIEYVRERAIKATSDDDVAIILRTNEDVRRFYGALSGMGNVSARWTFRGTRDYDYLRNTPVKIRLLGAIRKLFMGEGFVKWSDAVKTGCKQASVRPASAMKRAGRPSACSQPCVARFECMRCEQAA